MAKHNKIQCSEYYVTGMHCASCEILIEKNLLKNKNIQSVEASLENNKVRVCFKNNQKPDLTKLNEQFQEMGYQFSSTKPIVNEPRLISFSKNGELQLNPAKLKNLLSISFIIFGLVLIFVIFNKLHLITGLQLNETSSWTLYFLLGLIAGSSSCAALSGGVLLSMSKQWHEVYAGASNGKRALPHLLFHFGRLASFLLLGGLLGLFGSVLAKLPIFNDPIFFSLIIIAVSIVMIILALQMLEVRWAQKFKISLPKAITKYSANEENFKGKYMPFVSGFLTFFLPCGFTLTAMTASFLTNSYRVSAINMFSFALGTLPMLTLISFSGVVFNRKPGLTRIFNKVAGVLVILFALYTLNAQLNVLGISSISDFNFPSKKTTPINTTVITDPSESQSLKITASGFSYTADSSTTLKAGVLTKMEVNNQGIQGCAAFMAARGLFDGYLQLKPGINTKEFTPVAGTYKLTCTMGMVKPLTIKVI
ncbi:MAG: sulfite exporter TauE/SafE family protein [bacterium]